MSDSRRYESDRYRDDRDHRDRDYGRDRPQRAEPRHNRPYSPERRALDRSRYGDNTQDHGTAPSSNRSGPPERRNTSSTSASTRREAPIEHTSPKEVPSVKPTAKAEVAPPSPTPSNEKMSQFAELISHRAFLYQRRERADSHCRKTTAAYERCRTKPSDFGSAPEVLLHQKKMAEEDIKKFDLQMSEIDEKLLALWNLVKQILSQTSKKSSPGDASDEPSALDAKFSSIEESHKKSMAELEHKLKTKFAMELQHFKSEMQSEMKSHFEQQILRVQMDMASMTERSERSESEISELKKEGERLKKDGERYRERIATLEDEAKRRDQRDSKREEASIQAAEPGLAVGKQAEANDNHGQAIALIEAKLAKLPLEDLQTLPMEFSNFRSEVRDGLGNIPTELASLRVQVQHSARSSPNLVTPSEERERSMEFVKSQVASIVQKFGPFIDEERKAREALKSDMERRWSNLRGDLDALKEQQSKTLKQADDVTQLGRRIVSIDNRVDGLISDHKAHMDAIHLQLQTVTSWQTNFDTRGLYRDIVNHINTTMPSDMRTLVDNHESRLQAVEETHKRRKVANSSISVSNGRQ